MTSQVPFSEPSYSAWSSLQTVAGQQNGWVFCPLMFNTEILGKSPPPYGFVDTERNMHQGILCGFWNMQLWDTHTVTKCSGAFLAHTCAPQKLELKMMMQRYILGKSTPGLTHVCVAGGLFLCHPRQNWFSLVLTLKYPCLMLKCWLAQNKEKRPCQHSLHSSTVHYLVQ